MGMSEEKGPGRGRGPAGEKGFETGQTADISALEARVATLEARVAALEGTPAETPPA